MCPVHHRLYENTPNGTEPNKHINLRKKRDLPVVPGLLQGSAPSMEDEPVVSSQTPTPLLVHKVGGGGALKLTTKSTLIV